MEGEPNFENKNEMTIAEAMAHIEGKRKEMASWGNVSDEHDELNVIAREL